MKRRQLLAAGGISAAAVAVGVVGPDNVIGTLEDTFVGVGNLSLPAEIDGSWTARNRNPQNARYIDRETSLSGPLELYWEQESEGKSPFQAETARVRDGVLYVSTEGGKTYAMDARSGSVEWTVDIPADDIAVPAGDTLYLSHAQTIDSDTVVFVESYDKETGERLETLYDRQIDYPLIDLMATEQYIVGREKGYPGTRVISRSSGVQVDYLPSTDGYAVFGDSIYLSDGESLTAYALDSWTERWTSSETWAEPYDPSFTTPVVQDGLIFVEEQNRNELVGYGADGGIVQRYEIPTDTPSPLLITPDSVYIPATTEEESEIPTTDKTLDITKYSRSDDGELSEQWQYNDDITGLHCGFTNGLVATDLSTATIDETHVANVDVPGLFDESGRTRFIDEQAMLDNDVGPVFPNALFTIGTTVQAWAPE